MATYTFITDFQGGTYICQKDAVDLRSTGTLWKEDVAAGDYIPKLKVKSFLKAVEADMDEFPPIRMDGLRNVWLFHLLLGDDQMDLHIIQTDTSMVDVREMAATHI